MKRKIIVVGFMALFIMGAAVAINGCKGSETRDAIDETVETVSGKEQVDQMQKMKRDIDKAAKMRIQRRDSALEEQQATDDQ